MKTKTEALDLRLAAFLAVVLSGFATVPAAQAQPTDPAATYPSRPVRIVSGSGPGSANDILARLIGQSLSQRLKQSFIVDNRAGASGLIGAEVAAKSPRDGYTLFLGFNGNLAALRALRKQLPYDPVKDFDPVTLVASIPGALVVHPSLPARSVKELIALAKARPGRLDFATYGVGSGSHMAGELFKSMAGIQMTSVSYKSSTQAVTDLVAGNVQLMIHSAPVVLPQAQAGKLRALAVTSAKRSAMAPDLPTMSEAGVPGYELIIWFGFLVPAGTPAQIVDRLNREINAILGDRAVRDTLLPQGFEPIGGTPAEFAKYLQTEIARYTKIVKDAGIAME
jgi:tripartite-type tricarboxylate transporter receptor subunit TctC